MVYPKMVGVFHGKSQSNMDDDWRSPYFRNLQNAQAPAAPAPVLASDGDGYNYKARQGGTALVNPRWGGDLCGGSWCNLLCN